MSDYTAEIGDPVQVGQTLYRLRIDYDQYPDVDPRQDSDCHLGIMVGYHRDYELPQEQTSVAVYGWDSVYDLLRDGRSPRVIARWLRMFHGSAVVLPLYVGGDGRVFAGTDDAETGDGATGLIFDTPETRRAGWGDDVSPSTEVIRRNLIAEVDQYGTWQMGEMTGWIVESYILSHGEDANDAPWDGWDHADSCWGYYSVDEARECGEQDGLNPAVAEARQNLADHAAEDEALRVAELGGVL